MLEIYFPMSCRILTKGHIKALEKLVRQGYVTVGLLTDEALRGYKKPGLPYEDRFYILDTLAYAIGNMEVVPQGSLDPSENIRRYKCNALASGDGFEEVELKAIKKYKLKRIDVKSGETIHASDLLK